MNMKHAVCILATITTMALAGCGGGGSSPMSNNNMNDMPGNMGGDNMNTPATTQLTESQLYGNIGKYSEVAANAPGFGSITQSSNGNNGIATDRVETMLHANGELTVTVRDGTGAVSLELDSRQHEHTDLNGTVWISDDGVPSGWSGNGWVLSKQDGNDVVVSVAYTRWNDSDETNYLAGGYWVKSNQTGVTEMGTFGDTGEGSVFNYYDGQDSSWQIPTITGTATYRGEAEGAYTADGEAGIWWGQLRLDANFATNSISGCVGCQTAGDDPGIYTYTTLDDLTSDTGEYNDLYVSLEGSIRNDGRFDGTLGIVDGLDNNNPDSSSHGKWGGLFSENTDAADTPNLAIGTLGGTAGDIGFIGVFYGQQ